jgi:hypothetical protein
MRMFCLMCLLLLLSSLGNLANAAIWQWSVQVKDKYRNQESCRAYLWVPKNCKKIKGFIFAQNNMEEQSILEDVEFRKAMARLDIAEVWVSPAYDLFFNFQTGAGETFQLIMDDLAKASGHQELGAAPFIGIGHSAAASAPYYMAAWKPNKALAAISVSGQWPYFRHPNFAPDVWGSRNIDYVPCLETMGEYEAANIWSAQGLKERKAHPLMPLSMLAAPAEGHFAYSKEKAAYIALYIKKVMHYRMPKSAGSELVPIDPTKTGWLADKWRVNQKPLSEVAPVSQYKGNPEEAFWFFDEELAKATVAYQAKHRAKKPQLLGFMENGKMVAQRNTHQQINLKFEPLADGITFILRAGFYDSVPAGSPRPELWSGIPAESPIGHSDSATRISIERISGPVIKLNDSTFRVQPRDGFRQQDRGYELWFAATHPGDEKYKPAVQQAQMLIPTFNKLQVQTFTHPGVLHSRADLDRMKRDVQAKREPAYSGYKLFLENPASAADYKMKGPMSSVGRNPTIGQSEYDSDANAAHQNAVMWAVTGERAYAEKSIEIINAWSSTLKSITGRDAVLMAGLGPFKMINAAEILRYTNTGWKPAEIRQAEQHFRTVIYPVIQDFALFANGNWDAAAVKTVMAIGVFCNDRAIFERGLRYYVDGAGDGALGHYIINNDGQIQESGRDQGHTQLGIGMLAECSEIAWKQGLDLFSHQDNLLLKGFEYTAKYNLGHPVPFSPTLDHTGKYAHKIISKIDSGKLRAVYEQVYNHYVKRKGLTAPFTQQAAEKLRPEGPGKPGADHPGYGTLYYSLADHANVLTTDRIPAAPAGLTARGQSSGNLINWIASIDATGYTLKRADREGGPYTVIAENIVKTDFTDQKVKPGQLYFYTVTASNKNGESKRAFEVSVSAGLPGRWKYSAIGQMRLPGSADFDGSSFKLTGTGMGIDSLQDQVNLTSVPLKADGEITVRFVPQVNSQFSQMGLTFRDGLAPEAAQASLILLPGKSRQIEAPRWQVRMLARKSPGTPAQIIAKVDSLPVSAVTNGRLTGYYWLRLNRKAKTVRGYISPDGVNWTLAGSVILSSDSISMGMILSSGLTNIPTTANFDHVTVNIP